ncbi:MAG: hypothetical protein ACI945_000374 [Pseudohongiellaceae bacterium]|jgi:hypothetical protein|tara:strand:- start:1675 stop:2340 length:666 start_codon:yes stop_codon:yes gene_type:complete
MYLFKKTRQLSLITVSLLMMACVSIPPEAPELSAQLGNRISAIEQSNLTLLHRYFDRKKQDVDEFIQNEWVPEFANQFFSEPAIATVWDQVVASGSKQDRLKFILKTSPKLQQRINQKRVELIHPLEVLEQRIETKLTADYAQAKAINNSITGFLLSASKVVENRDRYLEMVGVTSDEITQFIDKTDSIVADLLQNSQDLEGKVTKGEKYLQKINELRASI